jgi:heat shock protein HtpX
MKRIFLFVLTNIAILVVIAVVVHLFGFDRWLNNPQGGGAYGLNYVNLLGFSLVVGFAGSFISLALSKWMAKQAYNIHVIESPSNETEQWLVDTVQGLAAKAGVAMPEVGIYDSPEVNAFATGPSRANALVAVSSGLLQAMSRTEASGVLGHGMSHVANGDMVTMTLLQGVLNTFVVFLSRVFGFFIDQALSGGRDRREAGTGIGYFLSVIVLQIVLGFLASLVVFAFSRWREYHADAGSARLEGSKEPMLAALRRLKAITEGDPVIDDRSPALQAFKISGKPGSASLFADHPSLDDRIAALERLQG